MCGQAKQYRRANIAKRSDLTILLYKSESLFKMEEEEGRKKVGAEEGQKDRNLRSIDVNEEGHRRSLEVKGQS